MEAVTEFIGGHYEEARQVADQLGDGLYAAARTVCQYQVVEESKR